MSKKIILGVTASIAAYKSCELVRLFKKSGYDVYVVMTGNAHEFVGPLTFETLSCNPVYTDSFIRETRMMGHISLKDDASLMVIAPATANIISKFASGIADDLLSTTFLSVNCPVLIAPAMNPFMWKHPAIVENVEKLKGWGVKFTGPDSGVVACGDLGEGKMTTVETIFNESEKLIK